VNGWTLARALLVGTGISLITPSTWTAILATVLIVAGLELGDGPS
jgi:hypothetical protein